MIWTTTPWTIPANLGIAVHPEFAYAVVEVKGEKYLLAEDLLQDVARELGWETYERVKTVRGEQLEYVVAKHPFYDRDSLVVLGEHVTKDSGTGCVHTAPGHGEEDFYVGQKYGLGVLSPIDDRGYFTQEAPGFEGLFYDEANKAVTKKLEEVGALLKLGFITHSYPHDWRTKKPVIFRATMQWFASIDPIREQLLKEIQNVRWYTKWGETRLYNMIRDRGDWCISRQRLWGVPIPVFYAENGEAIITDETIEHVAQLFERHGSNIWFEWDAKDLLPEGFEHPGSPNGIFRKEKDIMDVWFDSSSSHYAVLKTREELHHPADVYLEGSDQYRGWFNSSLITSVAVSGHAPYRAVLSNGFTVDGEGRKMSKSLGNVISPEEITRQFGADVLRLRVSSVDYTADVKVFMDNFTQVSEVYRKIRNTFRFMLGNLADFDPEKDAVPYERLREVDRYMLVKLNRLIRTIRSCYDNYNFSDIYHEINKFMTVDLSAFYLDFAKDVLYIEEMNSPARRAMQTVIYECLTATVKLLAPILVHTAEEVWGYIPGVKEESVQLTDFPEARTFEDEEKILQKWDRFMKLRDHVLKALELARNEKRIGKSLEAKVSMYVTPEIRQFLDSFRENLGQIFIVSKFEIAGSLEEAPDGVYQTDQLAIAVSTADGETCQRCWMVTTDVGTDEEHPTLCRRCASIVREHYAHVLQ